MIKLSNPKTPATRAALQTTSFMSAASFQETTKVLNELKEIFVTEQEIVEITSLQEFINI